MSQPHRWVCPRCQANNMPTSGQCFRCGAQRPVIGARLPPPATPQPRPSPPRTPQAQQRLPAATSAPGRRSPWTIFAPVVLLVVAAMTGVELLNRFGPPNLTPKKASAPSAEAPPLKLVWVTLNGAQSGGRIENISTQPVTGIALYCSRPAQSIPPEEWAGSDLPISDNGVVVFGVFPRWGQTGDLLSDGLSREDRVLNPGEYVRFSLEGLGAHLAIDFPAKVEITNGYRHTNPRFRRIPFTQELDPNARNWR